MNLILATDSYKLTHWNQYPAGTQTVYSYLESRKGAEHQYTTFFGLQYLIKKYLTKTPRWQDLSAANTLARAHFGRSLFNYTGWSQLIDKHCNKLPVRIKAVPEGGAYRAGTVLMTIENTDPEFFWLTNALESLLMHVWYPSTVATVSRDTIASIRYYLTRTAESSDGLPFMLHDFGYRGASSHESASTGGAGHLIHSRGTDTLPAMELLLDYYSADLSTLGFSVPATEHSVMTAEGDKGEPNILSHLFEAHPDGILSVVADSYNIYNFVNELGTTWQDAILSRDGVFVVRPDSVTQHHPTPEDLMQYITERLWERFGGIMNSKGFCVLDPHIRILWGDGIDPEGIKKILKRCTEAGFSAENYVFGMGGGLLQKLNRDTQRFAFKCSAQQRDGVWHDIYKDPLDQSKASKRGRFDHEDQLELVFENGVLHRDLTFEQVRQNSEII